MAQAIPELIVNYACDTGEGPLWHPDESCLYWLDIPRGRLFRYTPANDLHASFDIGIPIGGMTLQTDGALLLFMAEGAVRTWRDGAFESTIIESIPREHGNRFNDVIADPEGRVFCGVMSTPDRAGCLYRLESDRTLTVMLKDTGTANGMGFTLDLKQMYFCDSRHKTIAVFDYSRATGDLSNRRILLNVPDDKGKPDGMTVDADGNLWSARWDGARLVQLSPAGEELMTIDFPVKKVSCVTFGGPDYTDIYVTTAGGQDTATNGELAGGLFHLNLGIAGRPEFRSKIR